MSNPRASRLRGFRPLTKSAALSAAVALAFLNGTPAMATEIRAGEWPLDARHFQVDRVWSVSSGAGVTVAVVDSGVDASHPDLAGQVLPGVDELGAVADDGRIDTSADSHGTAIAGIIAGTGQALDGMGMKGLAPGAKILPVRVSSGSTVDPATLAAGVIWAADHGASVINVSIGSPRPDPVLRKAITYAQQKDAVIVASAGNSGTAGNLPMYPASFPGVVSVAGAEGNGKPWKESEFGPGITLSAPATDILSTNNQGQYVKAEGTSYAAAYVSATIALIRSHDVKLTSGQAIRRLISTTSPHYASPDSHMGAGEVDPLAALTSNAAAGDPSNPLPLPAAPAASPRSSVPWPLIASLAAATLVTAGAGAYWFQRRRGAAQPQPRPITKSR